MTNKQLQNLAWWILGIGIGITVFFVASTWNDGFYVLGRGKIDFPVTGQFGDFIGGFIGTLISIVGFILLYITLREQRQTFQRERMENRFFEMIKFHRDNVNEMRHSYWEIANRELNQDLPIQEIRITYRKQNANGRELFERIYTEFKEVYDELTWLFEYNSPENVYVDDYLGKLNRNGTFNTRDVDLLQTAKIDISYLIVFFGNDVNAANIINSLCEGRYNRNFIAHLLFYISLKPENNDDKFKKWQNIVLLKPSDKQEVLKRIKDDREGYKKEELYTTSDKKFDGVSYLDDIMILFSDTHYYKGHQVNLGHYFRNLFQAVTYIDGQNTLSYNEKYSYIKMLRAQFSTTEQIIFYLNSICIIGRIWEYENKVKPELAIEVNKQLVTKYNLIKNIPFEVLAHTNADLINIRDYYPDIAFEAIINNGANERREKLKNQYY